MTRTKCPGLRTLPLRAGLVDCALPPDCRQNYQLKRSFPDSSVPLVNVDGRAHLRPAASGALLAPLLD